MLMPAPLTHLPYYPAPASYTDAEFTLPNVPNDQNLGQPLAHRPPQPPQSVQAFTQTIPNPILRTTILPIQPPPQNVQLNYEDTQDLGGGYGRIETSIKDICFR